MESEIVGFAYPVYGSDIPAIMKTFLKTDLKDTKIDDKKSVVVLTSMLFFSGDGALIIKKYLDKTIWQLKWTKNFALTSNLSVPGFKANPVSIKKLNKRKNKSKEVLNRLLMDIEKGRSTLRAQWGIIGRFLGGLQRIFEKYVGDVLLKFSVDPKRCIKCLKCVKECPTENIIYDEMKERINFSNNCTWCMRCYTRCPTQAVLVREKYCDPQKYRRLKPISEDFKIN